MLIILFLFPILKLKPPILFYLISTILFQMMDGSWMDGWMDGEYMIMSFGDEIWAVNSALGFCLPERSE